MRDSWGTKGNLGDWRGGGDQLICTQAREGAEGDQGDWRDCGDQWIRTQVRIETAGDRGRPRRLERLWKPMDTHTQVRKEVRGTVGD